MAQLYRFNDCLNRVDQAEKERKEIIRLTEDYPELTVEEGYFIQEQLIARRVAEGNRVVGYKLGLTSKAKQEMIGVYEPSYGVLLDYMQLEEGDPVPYSELIHPRAEPEIAFFLQEDLQGPKVSGVDVLAATKFIFPAIEIIDSRFQNFKLTLPDGIADNSSSARFILGGRPFKISDVDLSLMGMVMTKNGEVETTGAGAAVLGHPASAVAWLANKLHERGEKLNKGQIILSGGITAAIEIKPGDIIQARFDKLGSVTVKCSD
ncbi:MAG TPA: 4-oxalocrotonate decarboxylase [Paenibacillaceae bacterium]|nr:4-oxalocrotonate decarboxylase [Paenibacillaceae bacterium]